MKDKFKYLTSFSVDYDNLLFYYHDYKLVLLRLAYKQATEFYNSGNFKHAQLSFLFIIKECEVFLPSVESLSLSHGGPSYLISEIKKFISEIKKSISECEDILREMACQ